MNLNWAEKLASGCYWKVPAFLDSVQPALTDDAVSAAELQLRVKLPEAYLALLRQQKGGYLRATWPASYSRMRYGIGSKAPSITLNQARWRPRNIVPEAWAPPRCELLIPFDGDGHWDRCFDYRKVGPRAEPSITLVDSECQELEPVARSFPAFLAGLVDQLRESTRIYRDPSLAGSGPSAESVARQLAQQLGASSPHTDKFAHGHASWRIGLRGDHQWCWVSASRVPAGFRHEGESKRVVMTDHTGLQIPEDPDCVVLVSSTSESRAAVSNALATLGLCTELAIA